MQAAFSTSRTGCRAATRTVTRKSVSAGRRPAETRCWWIALAMLALSPVGAPVAAQSGSEAVVCVGSERRTLATNPIRRIYMEDMSSRNDGSGYEVLLRESWGVADEVATAAEEPEFTPPDGPICTGRASSEGCWMEISNHPGCCLWNPQPVDGATVVWSGECSEGFANGMGEERWRWSDGSVSATGIFQDGRREGFHVIIWGRAGDDNVVREEGSYVNDERHGTWTGYDASGNVVGTLRYENGRLNGRFPNPVAPNRSFQRPLAEPQAVAHGGARETESIRGSTMSDRFAHPGGAVRYKVN